MIEEVPRLYVSVSVSDVFSNLPPMATNSPPNLYADRSLSTHRGLYQPAKICSHGNPSGDSNGVNQSQDVRRRPRGRRRGSAAEVVT
jgi:hypothetical protein